MREKTKNRRMNKNGFAKDNVHLVNKITVSNLFSRFTGCDM